MTIDGNIIPAGSSAAFWTSEEGSTARKWGTTAIGTGASVTYCFNASDAFTATEKATIRESFALWAAEANIKLTETTDQTAANVLLRRTNPAGDGEYFDGGSTTVGQGTTDGQYKGQTTINFDTATRGFDLSGSFDTYGGYGIAAVVHEMGHLLGLGHGGAYDGDVTPSSDQYSAYDSRLYTIMSYIEPDDTSAKYYASYPMVGTSWGYSQSSTTPMSLDILAAQQIYGAPVGGPLSGGNVFGFHTNIDASIRNFFDFTVDKKPVIALFDTGTDNTLDLSGFTTRSTVNLAPGTFSSVGGLTNNIAIAYNTVIDHVIGGSAADFFTGTSGAETFTGGLGADSFTGGGGNDLFKDTAVDLNGDTITDWASSYKIDVTDAAKLAGLSYANNQLSFKAGATVVTMTIMGATGLLQQAFDSVNGGIDIFFTPAQTNATLFGATTFDVTSTAGQVYALYETVLGRAPDPVGLEAQVAMVAAGGSLSTVAQNLLSSSEFASDHGSSASSTSGFVNRLYLNGLHRQADSGASGMIYALDHGMARAQAAIAVATSQESQQGLTPTFQAGVFVPDAGDSAAARLYYGLLNRVPDAAGLKGQEDAIHGGARIDQLVQTFLGSDEYRGTAAGQDNLAYVDSLYQTALGRDGDAAGRDFYQGSLDTGLQSRADVANAFLTSSEFQAGEAAQGNDGYIDTVYRAALGRHADAGGVAGWNAMLAGGASRVDVARKIVDSDEFAAYATRPGQASFVTALYEGALGRDPAASEIQGWQNALASGVTRASAAVSIAESPEARTYLTPKIEAGFFVA